MRSRAGSPAWISKTLQPQAKAILGTQVVKLHNATSYSCRNRYGGETTPLSEHALANALDISEFVFEFGREGDGAGELAARCVPKPSAETTGSVTPPQTASPTAIEAVEVTQAKASPKRIPLP